VPGRAGAWPAGQANSFDGAALPRTFCLSCFSMIFAAGRADLAVCLTGKKAKPRIKCGVTR